MVMTFTETSKEDSFGNEQDLPPSKTQRKKNMLALQSLGEALVGLSRKRLESLNLPPRLFDAIVEAERITARGARSRQFQFIGRLMRDIDPEPVQRQLALWEQGLTGHEDIIAQAENWRENLMVSSDALDQLLGMAAFSHVDKKKMLKLIEQAKTERASQLSPVAYRKLFKQLKEALLAAQQTKDCETD